MWRSSRFLLERFSAVGKGRKLLDFSSPRYFLHPTCLFSGLASKREDGDENSCNISSNSSDVGDKISISEAKKLLRLVNVGALKRELEMHGEEAIGYSDLLKACESMGVARSAQEAAAFAQVLDEAGVVLLFRDKVYLHPDKVLDLVRRAVPLALTSDNDPRKEELKLLQKRKEELKLLQKKKEEIDMLARRHAYRILWTGLGVYVISLGFVFRLTFWEFSWDVVEPAAFFTTMTGVVIGYAYFLLTRKNLTYQDLMEWLFLSKQRKLFRKQNFDINRFMELQKQCKSPLDNVKALGLESDHLE